MAQVFYVSSKNSYESPYPIDARAPRHLTSLAPLLKVFFKKANQEQDVDVATVVVIEQAVPAENKALSELDYLSYSEKMLLLRYFFGHMNLIVISFDDLKNEDAIVELNAAIHKINHLLKYRTSRVATWTGTGININDFYADHNSILTKVQVQISDIVTSMSFMLYHQASMSHATEKDVIHLKDVIMRCIDFVSLLEPSTQASFSKLCHCVGHWAFPSHELSNDDLLYCMYLILGYAINYIKSLDTPCDMQLLSPNELLGMIFMTRDTYKNGNPFHNFRHAADVTQACFHFLVKLGCLPEFEQLESDPRACELSTVYGRREFVPCVELVACESSKETSQQEKQALLSPIQSLGLLVSALGHDVGHPGVTNAFMIKYSSPTSQIYGGRSVLESFHATIFTNKILSINWPSLLHTKICDKGNLKSLINTSILATDMAEHFEYINKLKEFPLGTNPQESLEQVHLICSVLIKCADISNVTRPLRVSAQWASLLSREFEEVEILEDILGKNSTFDIDASYEKLPMELKDVLESSPNIQKGQIFFIQTFAEGLFNTIVEQFPQLQYTAEIVSENKRFWLVRADSSS